ncbi:MAG: hypothetical protein OEW06_18415, partial [Gemmatimonadota bacterium]|nr:hypothetical protein [Gemmatimonadota bacterium]
MSRHTIGAALGVLLLIPTVGLAQTTTLTCDDNWNGDGERVCEIRDFTLPAGRSPITIDGGPNGGVRVHGWDRNEIRVFARVQANAETESRAQEIAGGVTIATSGTIEASGPGSRHHEWWSVTFEAFVPNRSDLNLETVNGGVRIEDVHGQIRFQVTNGGVSLAGLGGDVQGRTTNGGIRLSLAGSGWDGAGADVRATNGGIVLMVPDGYSAHLEAGTTNGALSFDFPVTVQ